MSAQFGNCPFCEPVDSHIKENETARLVLSNPRKVPGHCLVVPKRHIERTWELTAQELQDIFELINHAEQKMIGKLGEGCDIRQNYRPFMKQNDLKVDHLQFHVIPRGLDDYIHTISEQFEAGLFAELDDVERAAVSKTLR